MGRAQIRERPMRKNPKGENDFLPVRFMDAGIRSMEGEGNERRFELSFLLRNRMAGGSGPRSWTIQRGAWIWNG